VTRAPLPGRQCKGERNVAEMGCVFLKMRRSSSHEYFRQYHVHDFQIVQSGGHGAVSRAARAGWP
jgi:hypothetical protein